MLFLTVLPVFLHLVLSMEQSRPAIYHRRVISSDGTETWEPVYSDRDTAYNSRTFSTSGSQPVYTSGERVFTSRTSSTSTGDAQPVYTGGDRVYTSRTSTSTRTSGTQPVYGGEDRVYTSRTSTSTGTSGGTQPVYTHRTVQTVPGGVVRTVYPGERVYTRRTVQTVPAGWRTVYTGGDRVYTQPGSTRTRTVYEPYYQPAGTSRESSSASSGVCPETGARQYINGLSCREAVASMGPWLCYNYAKASRECCEACLNYKISDDTTCMYGDRSRDCARSLRPSQCYDPFNKNLCCQTCPRLKDTNAEPGCEYGDKDPTQCPNIRASHCYSDNTANICCHTCARFNEQYNQPGCEYGDKAAQFYAPGYGFPLDCRGYISAFGIDRCKEGDTKNVCCFTCAGQ